MANESSPLLPPSIKPDVTSTKHEARILVTYALPVMATNLLRQVVMSSSVIAVARLGTRELAAANLGVLSANIGGYAIIVGLVSAMDTLANQASKSSSPKLASIYAMRTFVVCCMAMPFLFLFTWNGRLIFSILMPNAEPEMLKLAADYMKVISLGLPALAAYECIRRYLSSLGLLLGPTLAYGMAAPVSMLLSYMLVWGSDATRIGFLGGPLAVVISYYILLFIMFVYALLVAPRHTWAGLSWTIFQDLGIVIQFGLAGIASTCSEWWAFEMMGVGATYLGEVSQASNAIYSTTMSVAWNVPLAISVAVSIRIGNLLGQNLPFKAAKSAVVTQYLACLVVVFNAIFLLSVKKFYGRIFSRDPEVISSVDRNMYVLAVVTLFDGMQGGTTGILKGSGLPGTAARINLVSYWLIGLPIGALMSYKTQEVAALWGGLAIACFFSSTLMAYKIWTNDWTLRAEEALVRIKQSETRAKSACRANERSVLDC